VLVVEDEPHVRRVTVDALRDLGYRVLEAESGSRAIELLETGPTVDLLLTDVVMPAMNGRELAEIVRARWSALPILFTTGYMRSAIADDDILAPHAPLLSKPFTVEQLARQVGAALTAHAPAPRQER
jgi:CheY-like chemotaxis protein